MKSSCRPPSFRLLATTVLLALSLGGISGQAAIVTWGTPQGISSPGGESDVSTAGALVGAFNLGDTGVSSQTLNGVPFQSFAVPNFSNGATVGNFAFASSNALVSANGAFASPNAPYSTLTAAYQAVLASGLQVVTPMGSPATLTISGLVVGAQYQFQWWSNNSQTSPAANMFATAGNSVLLNSNTSFTNGGLGQFVLGSFTADATTEVISFSGSPGILNAFQLRQTSAVPETGSTLALLALALGGIALAARRQNPATKLHSCKNRWIRPAARTPFV